MWRNGLVIAALVLSSHAARFHGQFIVRTLPTPVLTSLSVTTGPVGTTVVLTGTGFGASQGAGSVVFLFTTATPSAWSNTSITVTVPVGAVTGDVHVNTVNGPSNRIAFTVTSSGGGSNPIDAARLPMLSAAIPNPYWSTYVGANAPNGIPSNTWTRCGSVINPAGTTTTTINNAISACAANHYVELGAGTFTFAAGTGGITLQQNNVAIRGQGPNSTFLIFNDDAGCLGQFASICLQGNGLSYYIGEGTVPAHVVNWTAGYANGTTQITLANTSGLTVGMYLVLDQLNDMSVNGDVTVCAIQGTCTVQSGAGLLGRGCNADNTCRMQHQWVKALACSPACGGAGSTVVTIDHPIHDVNWKAVYAPQAWWGSSGSINEFMGVEELSIESRAHTANGGILNMVYVANSWVKHVRMLYAPTPKAFTIIFGGARNTFRDSYAFGTADASCSSTHYGVEDYGSNDNLIENNIWDHRTSPFVRDGTSGSVYGYNFAIDNCYLADPVFMQADQYSHAAGNQMILVEGNSSVAIKGDIIHGTSNLFTIFRNLAVGWEVCPSPLDTVDSPCIDPSTNNPVTNKVQETIPMNLYAVQRYWNIVGNVLGKAGYHTAYHNDNIDTSIYHLGSGSSAGAVPIPFDPVVAQTTLLWGNWDTVTNATRWCGNSSDTGWVSVCGSTSEVPSGISVLPNPVPGNELLPTSYYLSAKPAFMGANDPWPGIGPDVNCAANCVSGYANHATMNPAERCYRTIMTNDPNYTADASGGRPKIFNCNYPLP